MTLRSTPNLALAKRIANDISCDDVPEVYAAIQRRAPGLLFINARFDELSRDQYDDLCFAVESELRRLRGLRLVTSAHATSEIRPLAAPNTPLPARRPPEAHSS